VRITNDTEHDSGDDLDVERVLSFVNTLDPVGDDELDTVDQLDAWLRERALVAGDDRPTAADLRLARSLRAGLLAELLTHHGEPPDRPALVALDEIAADLPLTVSFTGGSRALTRPALRPAGSGVRGGLAAILASVMALQTEDRWSRLKACPDATCLQAFYDASRNRSRRWCSMESCGNRAKVRGYRARQG
jgi:predicted RNA-binding Zn ribbon-like protein